MNDILALKNLVAGLADVVEEVRPGALDEAVRRATSVFRTSVAVDRATWEIAKEIRYRRARGGG